MQARRRVEGLRARHDLMQPLSTKERMILDHVFTDLFEDGPPHGEPRFALSTQVAAEINSYPDDRVLPRYLVHRYRYEIYPQRYELDGFPPYLQIEPTSVCNYRCVFCFQTDRYFTKKSNGFMGHMSLNLFKRIIDESEKRVEFLSLSSRGEPLLCREIEAMLAYTRGKFLNLKLNTNASLLDDRKCHAILQSGVKTVVFSADEATEPFYSRLRVGGELNRVLSNVERFQRIRKQEYPSSQIITRVAGVKFHDGQDLNAMSRVWSDLVDQIAFVTYNPWENVYERPVSEILTPCSDLWRRMFIWWDGTVNPCDVDYKSTLSVGRVQDCSLSNLWTSEAYRNLRAIHLNKKRSAKLPCKRCVVV